MEDETISTFCAFTSATPAQAQQYLALSDGNVENAVQLFFSDPGLAGAAPVPSQPGHDPITIPDDDDEVDDGDVEMTGTHSAGHDTLESDEAMARQLQEEMYGTAGGDIDPETGVRRPMARTTETLVGPGSGDWRDDPGQMNQAVFEQLAQRERARRAGPGIFNQRGDQSIWSRDDPNDPESHRRALARATAGASETTAKANLLAELFKPPFELISPFSFGDARDEGKENEKWIIVNVQDPSIFDCQVLNRDIWKNKSIQETIKEHFIFLQYNKNDPRGREYVQYYFANNRDNEDAYPHIAIVDPRTGEQVKTWSGSPAPKAADFLMDLHEFLDRYSLSFEKKNPVQAKRKESKKDVAQMSEEEMLEMALQNSLANGTEKAPKDEDPDALTRPADKGKAPAALAEAMDTADMGPNNSHGNAAPPADTLFSRISSSNPHEEPTSTGPDTTRIQFRYSGGRVVRRFALADPVRRIYEWLKASPLEGIGAQFDLVVPGKNLIEMLDMPIGEAGLKNGTVMVESARDDDE
ncbi:putative UBX domain protein [Teratosphaeria nubilosa]|uniref:Putative UBX domain protein n=1 Tax=Teratosphaeria nubilosa TaxID=161662 RepID=A0A6G1L4T2_9PEZI|nr:putative UBX domain protein [Teratosphaeria nubilosa]